MKEAKERICRLCLSLLDDEEFQFITDLQIQMLHIILPELSINVHQQLVVICLNCIESLDEAFAFKSAFLEIEDTIHGYKNDSQEPVDLEKLIGINDIPDNISKCGKVCRICLQLLEENSFLEILGEDNAVIGVLRKCLPEMDIQLTKHPMVCYKCITTLEKSFNFITLSLKKEAIIKDYLKIIDSQELDLYDVLRYTWSKEIENTPCPNKSTFEIHVKDEEIETVGTDKDSLHNPILSNLTGNEPKDDGIYVISDDDEDNKVNSSSISSGISVKTNIVQEAILKAGINNSVNDEIDKNIIIIESEDKKRRESYLTAVETMKAMAGDIDVPSDSDSMYSIETENSDDDDIMENESNKAKKKVAHTKGTHKSNQLPEDDDIVVISNPDIFDKGSVYSRTSENNNYGVNRSEIEGPGAKKRRKSIANNTSIEKGHSQVIEVSDNQNVYTIESDESDDDDISSVHSSKSEDDVTQDGDAIEVDITISDDETIGASCNCSNCTDEASFVTNNMVELFKCTHCSWEVLDKHIFDKHFKEYKNYKVKGVNLQKLEEDSRLFNCINCLFQTQNKSVIAKHVLEYHVESIPTSYMCAVCYATHKDKNSVDKCHPEKNPFIMYSCPFCMFHFDQKSKVVNHVLRHSAGNYSIKHFCKLCFLVCKSSELLRHHLVRHKIAEEIISYKCLKCSYQSTNRVYVREHIKKAHRRVSKCIKQTRELKRKEEDRRRVYEKCPICHKYVKYLVQHQREHKFQCDLCPYNAVSQMRLENHKSLHVYAQTGTVQTCQMCFAMFKRNDNFRKHMKVH